MDNINEVDVNGMLLTFFVLGAFGGVILSIVVSKLSRIPFVAKPFKKLYISWFSGLGYNGRYRKDGSIEFVRVQKNNIDVFVRFEENGEIRLTYRESEKPINEGYFELFNPKNNPNKGITFVVNSDNTYKTFCCENNQVSSKEHFKFSSESVSF